MLLLQIVLFTVLILVPKWVHDRPEVDGQVSDNVVPLIIHAARALKCIQPLKRRRVETLPNPERGRRHA